MLFRSRKRKAEAPKESAREKKRSEKVTILSYDLDREIILRSSGSWHYLVEFLVNFDDGWCWFVLTGEEGAA